MEAFKLFGKLIVDNIEALKNLGDTTKKAKETGDAIADANKKTDSSNKSTSGTFSALKSKVNEYKAQGMSTSQAWRQANADMKSSTENAGNGMVSAFKKVGLAVGTFLSVAAIKEFGAGCIQAAADANATNSQFSQVFAELESKASESLSGIADTAGISENRMKGSYTKIAAFAKTTGMDTESALNLSNRAMIAVADSAAFYDRSLEETTESLQSFLKGNFENDAALGLSCTEVTRNAAANKLYGKSFKDLSEEQKQLTLLQMVEDANKASGALGQAARESDTWTNVTGNLKQAWTDFQAVIGSKVLPAAVGVVKKMVSAVEGWTAKLPALIDWCGQHKEIIGAIAIVLGSVAAAIGIYNSGLTLAAVKTSIMTAASSGLAAVMGFITSPVTLVVLAIGALAAGFVVAYKKSETFRNFVQKMGNGIKDVFGKIKESAVVLKDKVSAAWDEITERCAPLVSAIKDNLLGAFDDIKERAQGLKDRFDELKQKFQPVIDIISGAFSNAAGSASGWFDKLTKTAGDLATGALSWLNEQITKARDLFNQFADFAGRLWNNLDPLVTLVRDNLVNALRGLSEPIANVKNAFGQIRDTIMNDVFPALKEHLLPLWENILKPALTACAGIVGGALVGAFGVAIGVINGIINAISGFAEMLSGAVEIVANVFDLIVGIFTLNGDKCKEALQGIWDGVCKVFGGLWDAVSGFLQGFVDGVVGFFKGLWDTLVGHSIVPDTIDGIVDCFAGLWNKVKSWVSAFKDGVVNAFNNVKEKSVSAFNSLKDKVSGAASAVKEKVSAAWNSVKEKTSSAFNSAKEKASSAFNTLKDKVSSAASAAKSKITSAWDSAKSKTSSVFSSIKSSVSNGVSAAYETVKSKFDAIKTKISNIMDSAKTTVSNAINKIKGLFDFDWSFPKLKMPHFSISGKFSLDPPSIPKISVDWYAKAMNNAMMLKQPTIFGYSAESGKYLGGGESGHEVVAGASTLMNMISAAVASQNDGVVYYLQKLIDILAVYFPQVLEMMKNPVPAVVDANSAAAALAVPMNRELGKLSGRKERGR